MILLILALELLVPEAPEADGPGAALVAHVEALWASRGSL